MWPTLARKPTDGPVAGARMCKTGSSRGVLVCTRLKISALWCKTNIHLTGLQLLGELHMATDKESQDISRRSFMKRTAMGGAGTRICAGHLGPARSSRHPEKSD